MTLRLELNRVTECVQHVCHTCYVLTNLTFDNQVKIMCHWMTEWLSAPGVAQMQSEKNKTENTKSLLISICVVVFFLSFFLFSQETISHCTKTLSAFPYHSRAFNPSSSLSRYLYPLWSGMCTKLRDYIQNHETEHRKHTHCGVLWQLASLHAFCNWTY